MFTAQEKLTSRRFDDADKAVQAALAGQEKAIAAALSAADRAVAAALAASKEAVTKAEAAADKRFDAANEVKATFTGALESKLSREEYLAQHQSLLEKVEAQAKNFNDRLDRVSQATDANVQALLQGRAGDQGKSVGLDLGWKIFIGIFGILTGSVSIYLALHHAVQVAHP